MSFYIHGMDMPTKENSVILITPQGDVWMIGDMPNEDTYLAKAKAIPAADVRPVVRGRWVWPEPSKTRDRPYCSNCLNDAYWDDDRGFVTDNYCPNCGADMREES